MKYFYDTEFHEDGSTIDFISIGIVSEDGREYYAVSNEFDTRRVAANNWLMDNVMSSIPHQSFIVSDFWGSPYRRDIWPIDGKPRHVIASEICRFVGEDPSPEFWAWYGAYDHVCLAQLFGRMVDLPSNIPMYTHDLKTLVREAETKIGKVVVLPSQPEGLHNALADARWNKVRYEFLRKILDA